MEVFAGAYESVDAGEKPLGSYGTVRRPLGRKGRNVSDFCELSINCCERCGALYTLNETGLLKACFVPFFFFFLSR